MKEEEKKKTGRPRLATEKKYMHASVTVGLHEDVCAFASEHGHTISWVVETAVREYMERHSKR